MNDAKRHGQIRLLRLCGPLLLLGIIASSVSTSMSVASNDIVSTAIVSALFAPSFPILLLSLLPSDRRAVPILWACIGVPFLGLLTMRFLRLALDVLKDSPKLESLRA